MTIQTKATGQSCGVAYSAKHGRPLHCNFEVCG